MMDGTNATMSPSDTDSTMSETNKPNIVLVALLDAWGILSALVVLFLIWFRKELRYTSYMWLISNAIFVSLVACTLVTPAIIHQDLGLKALPESFCFLYGFLIWIVQFMIPASLLMVLVDRIVYVCDPIVYVRKMGTAVLFAMIFVPWILAVVFAACTFLPFRGEIQQRVLDGNNNDFRDFKYCVVRLGFEYVQSRAKLVVSAYYAAPVVLLVTAILVLMAVLCHRRHCCVHHLDEFDFEFEDTRQSVCRAAGPVSAVTFVYFILLLPSLVVLFRMVDEGPHDSLMSATETAMWVFVSFEWFQPLLWAVLVPDIRYVIMRVFCCCCIEETGSSVGGYSVQKAHRGVR